MKPGFTILSPKQKDNPWNGVILTLRRKKKFKATASAGKVMVTVFWDCEGVILIDVMPTGSTINSEAYVNTLTKLKKRFQRLRRHNNPECHVHGKCTQDLCLFFENQSLEPNYSVNNIFTSEQEKSLREAPDLFLTLFLLYTNKLLEITCSPIYSFADDSTIISCMEPGKPLPSQEIAHRQHHLTGKNTDKAVSRWLANGGNGGTPNSFKLLGISINSNMSWHDHVVTIAKPASQKPAALSR
nr:unnamed protein product [Callosobruchus analis]